MNPTIASKEPGAEGVAATPRGTMNGKPVLDCPTCKTSPETRQWHTYCPTCGLEAPFGETPAECESHWNKMVSRSHATDF